MAGNTILAKMAVEISANNAKFATALNKSQRDLSSFTTGLTRMAGALGVAFGIHQIANFTVEVAKLSGEAKAVRAAFERLPNSTKLMEALKQATGGTVSELGLMKRAVQASNFDISLAALPRLLEFATLRAQQTGQSVDYLVDSIVTGIGRKSKLILDNLGISAVQLTEALGGASAAASTIGEVAEAVGKIAEENLKNMEGFSENASTKLQRLAASWENVKVAIGDASNETGVLGKSIDVLTASMDLLSSRQLSFWEKLVAVGGGPGAAVSAILEDLKRKQDAINKESKKQAQIIREVDRAFKEFNGDIDAYGKAITTHIYRTELLAEFTKRLTQETDDQVTTLIELKEVEKELLGIFDQTDITDQKKLKNAAAQILSIRAQIKAIEDLIKAEKEKKPKEMKVGFFPDIEAEGSLNPDLRNDQARNQAIAFADALNQVATSAEFAGGAVIKLENATGELAVKMKEVMDIGPLVASGISNLASTLGSASMKSEEFGAAILDSLGGFMQSFGASLIALGIGKIALDAFSGPAMIAAGFALGAAGAAIQGAMSGAGVGEGNASAPGRTPSEIGVNVRGKIKGYDLAIVGQKQVYKRGRTG